MAAASPALSNTSTETNTTPTVATPPSITAAGITNSANTSKSLRGLNKPKCIKCGNVARSRCPYQSCKSCCAKAQNPCHIHVLKGSSSFPEKTPASATPKVDQQSTEVSHSVSSHRVASLRQLSNNFAQFNNLQSPLRSRKPLTRKDAQLINEWRFLKLKEFKERNIETENEAFDRYMRNVSLLEEVFAVNSASDTQAEEGSARPSTCLDSADDSTGKMIAGLKLKLRSNPIRAENFRKRMQYIIDQGLKKLSTLESDDVADEHGDPDELGTRPKKMKSLQMERSSALSDLMDKLNKARSKEDLKACCEMKSLIFSRDSRTTPVEPNSVDICQEEKPRDDLLGNQETGYSPPKWFSTTTIDHQSLCHIDAHFCSLEDIEEL